MPADKSATPSADRPIKVLLVDDQPIVAEAVKRMLAGETDMDFHYCADPSRAVSEALQFSPTVILQDLMMPDIDGLTLVQWYRAHPKLRDIPLIVLSSREEATTKAEAFALGANDYLVKLPDRIELIARIRYHSRGYIALLQRNEAYRALTADLAQAAEYVMSLLPKPITGAGITTEWRYIPSAQLGGDSLGYHWIDAENFAMYVLDVSDHGVGVALFSVSALDAIRGEALPHVDFRVPEEVLGGLNQSFQMHEHNNLFFTCWYGVYHLPTRKLRYASGGHPPALLISNGEAPQQLLTSNPIIGAFPQAVFTGGCTLVKPGSCLYVYSDGVYEVGTPEGTIWGLEGLEDFLRQQPGGLADLDALHAYVQSIHGRAVLEDDFSILRVAFP
jgi:phosphoserine phosphatase RsbU/P